MVGKHPLDIVVSMLQERIVLILIMQLLEVHVSSNAFLVFVEHVIG